MKIAVTVLIDVDPKDWEKAYSEPLDEEAATGMARDGVDISVRRAYDNHDVFSVIGDTTAVVVG